MLVLEVGAYQSNEVAFAEDHDVLEELAPVAADPAFGHRVLPLGKYSANPAILESAG